MQSNTPTRCAPLKTPVTEADTIRAAPAKKAAHHSNGKFMTDLCGHAPHTVRKRCPHSQAHALEPRSETPMPATLTDARYQPHTLETHIDAVTGLFVLAETTEPIRHAATEPHEGEIASMFRARELARLDGTRVLSQDIAVSVYDNGDGRFEIIATFGTTSYDDKGTFDDDDHDRLELSPHAAWYTSEEAAFRAATELARTYSFGATVSV